uniref:Serine hydrolase-like protein n=1 Tax=Ciona intestinalis TaxID=7719 RepID=F6YNR2_CIOIN|nr:serine hydrolase-like protein [Ciona intestinalis]|eukprot:XP_002129625.1 serine hydrolase-like protein [Ciona intestinalis]
MEERSQYVGTSKRGISREFEIRVPWGIIAGKTFGDPANPPVLCYHGWVENCNTFDQLIQLLPQERCYVAIDMPGNGLSSGFPQGTYNTLFDQVAIIERVVRHFKWKVVTLMGHSMGGNVLGMYSGTFPDKVDKLILIDTLGVHPVPAVTAPRLMGESIKANYSVEYPQARKRYPYDVAKSKLLDGNIALDGEAADILLERGLVENPDGTFTFTHDIRDTFPHIVTTSPEVCQQFVTKITAATQHIIASDGNFSSLSGHRKEVTEKLMDCFTSCKYHESVYVEGKHYVHLTHPELLVQPISSFLQRNISSNL